jgi:hypothetical protein
MDDLHIGKQSPLGFWIVYRNTHIFFFLLDERRGIMPPAAMPAKSLARIMAK